MDLSPYSVVLILLVKLFLNNEFRTHSDISVKRKRRELLQGFLLDALKEFRLERTLESVRSELDSIGAQSVFLELLQMLSEFRSLDDLYNVFHEFKTLIESTESNSEEAIISRSGLKNSFLGQFIRKVLIRFNNMSFCELSSLYRNLRQYTNSSNSMDENFQLLPSDQNPNNFSHYVERDITEIQNMAPFFSRKFNDYYSKFLWFLQQREYIGAIESLHRCFDLCSVIHNSSQTNKILWPYCNLSLAILHFHFGHFSQAIQAIRETVKISQERNDTECLTLALSWLYRLWKQPALQKRKQFHRNLQQENLLGRCLVRCVRYGLRRLASMNLLAFAGHSLESFDMYSHRRSKDTEPMQSTLMSLLLPGKAIFSKGVSVRSCLQNSEKINMESESLMELLGTNHLVESNAWELFGNKYMCQLHAQLQSVHNIKTQTPEVTCLALCKRAQLFADEGSYSKALEMLIRAEKFTDFSNREIWFHSIGVILFDFFLNRCQWNAAESVAQQLLSLSSASSDARIHFDALHRRILLMIYRNQLTSALLSCNDLLEFALHHEWHHQIIVALLTLAEIHQKASSPITAIPYVLRSLSLAERHQYNSLHLTASVLLANLYFQLGDLEDAEDLIETVYLQVQQCSSDALKADIYLLMAKCSIVKLKGFLNYSSLSKAQGFLLFT